MQEYEFFIKICLYILFMFFKGFKYIKSPYLFLVYLISHLFIIGSKLNKKFKEDIINAINEITTAIHVRIETFRILQCSSRYCFKQSRLY